MFKKLIPLASVLALAPFVGVFAQDAQPEAAAVPAAEAQEGEKPLAVTPEKRQLYLKILGCYFAAQNGLEYATIDDADKVAIVEGFKLGIEGKFRDFEKEIEDDAEAMSAFVQEFQAKIRERAEEVQRAELKKIIDENKAKGAAYMEKCKEEGDYELLPSGVLVKTVKTGDENKPTPESYITVRYTGKFIDGTIFDSSERDEDGLSVQFTDKSEPIAFPMPLGQLIPGWVEALPTLGKGAVATLVIPSELAYGDEIGRLPPGSTLIFDIELVDVRSESPDDEEATLDLDDASVPVADDEEE